MKLNLIDLLWSTTTTIALAQPENIFFARAGNNSTECSDPRPNDCSFYVECLETRYHCGPTGYPLAYGQKYCQKFQDDASLLSSEGQVWMEKVMLCLQRDLVPYALDGTHAFANCSALTDYAFSTHATCYVRSGLCTLPVQDWETIVFQIVGVHTLFDSWDAVKATVNAAAGCAGFYLWAIERGVF